MKYLDAVTEYIALCKSSGKSESTIDSYSRTLRFFGAFLQSIQVDDLSAIIPATLTSWKGETANAVSPSSLRL